MKKIIRLLLSLALAMSLALSAMPVASAASQGGATVTSSALNLRSGPGVAYDTIATAPKGASVLVESSYDGVWYRVFYNGFEGYMSASYLSMVNDLNCSFGVGVITGDGVCLRSWAGSDADVLDTCVNGDVVLVNGVSGSWLQIERNGITGYVSGDYITMAVAESAPVATPAAQEPVYEQPAAEPVYEEPAAQEPVYEEPAAQEPVYEEPAYVPPSYDAATGSTVVETCRQYLGVPYVWGGTSPDGFDCSGLVYYTYQLCGYSIERVAQNIYTDSGEYVWSKSDLQPGDIICFGTSSYVWHVGLYIGNDEYIHAPSSGQVVRIANLNDYYGANNFVCGKRILT